MPVFRRERQKEGEREEGKGGQRELDGGKSVGEEWYDQELCIEEEICKRTENDKSMVQCHAILCHPHTYKYLHDVWE